VVKIDSSFLVAILTFIAGDALVSPM
jgi:hypothetical protein